MADPLSISASIAGLAGLVALADVIFRTTYRFAKTAKNVKEDVAQLATEAQDLAGVLHRLSLLASALEFDTERPTLRLHHVISCRQMLLRVEKTLSKATADIDKGKTGPQVRRALKWPFSTSDTRELLGDIARHKEILTLALAADSMDALLQCLSRQKRVEGQLTALATDVKQTKEIITNIHMNDQRRRVLDFFMAANPQRNLLQCIELRHPHTGLWLLDGEEFQQWLDIPNSRLWLSGIPGAGKTVLAGAMISEILQLSSSTVGVAFFFCDYKNAQTHEPIKVLQTVASQLARQNQEAYAVLEGYYKEIQPLEGLSSEPVLWQLKDIMHQMVACFEKVYMVIDGVDECGENAREVTRILVDIVDEEDSAISLSILSRDELVIRQALQHKFVPVEIEAQKDDVRLYVATELETRVKSGQMRLKNMALKDEILHALVNDNAGMFRWVACQLDYLCELPRDKDRRAALTTLPPTLNETYQRILQRINMRDPTVQHLVERCLHFIAVADPPLTIPELQEAVSIDGDTVSLDEDSIVDEASILQYCSSLVRKRAEPDGADSFIEFSHFTVAEYLRGSALCSSKLEKYRVSLDNTPKSFATACLRILCLEEMSYIPTGTFQDFNEVSQRNERHPFYPYAALLWPSYADNHWADATIRYLIGKLFSLEKTGIFYSWSLEMGHLLAMPSYHSVRQAISIPATSTAVSEVVRLSSVALQKSFTPLHIAAALGLLEVCKILVEKGADVNAMCQLGTPLHCAVSGTGSLVDRQELDQVSLHSSATSSNSSAPSDTVDCETEPITTAAHGQSGSTVFHHLEVFDRSRPHVVDLLLDRKAQPFNSPDDMQLSLFRAALATSQTIKNFDIVKSLVKAGIVLGESDFRLFENITQVPWGPSNADKEGTVKNFLSFISFLKDTSATSETASQLYPLAFNLITSLRMGGTGPLDKPPLETLDWAISDPFMAAIAAAQFNNVEELRHILEHHNLDFGKAANSQGQTILHIAVKNVAIESVELLLHHGCSPSVPDFSGMLPIALCAGDLSATILRLLLDHDREQVNARDVSGNTVWHIAAGRGACEILRVLIEKASDVQKHLEAINFQGFSPLFLAMDNCRPDAAALIVKHHPKLVSTWAAEISVMHLAAAVGSADLLRIVIDAGADTHQVADDGSTPLHSLGFRSTRQCVQLLKPFYPDLSSKNSAGLRPIESFVLNVQDSWSSRTAVSQLLQVFDDLIPSEALEPTGEGPTFWEQFWSLIGERYHRFVNFDQTWVETVTLRMVQLSLFEAHEKRRKSSAFPVFASAFVEKFYTGGLEFVAHTIIRLFRLTQYAEDAVNSYELARLLHYFIAKDNGPLAESLLGVGVNTQTIVNGYSALEAACLARNVTSVDLLKLLVRVSDATSLNKLNEEKEGVGLVHLLGAKRERGDVNQGTLPFRKLQFLVNSGADPNLRTLSGVSAVSFHVKNRRNDTAILLVDLGADPTLTDDKGYDSAIHAVLRGSSDFLVELRKREQKNRWSAQIHWAKKVNITWNRRMQRWGRGMSRENEHPFDEGYFRGCNALHIAALQAHTKVLEFYLKEGLINIDDTAEGGWTPMHFAAYRGSVSTIKLLCSWGAEVDAAAVTEIQDGYLWTPYRIAVSKRRRVATTLLSLGAQQFVGLNLGDDDDSSDDQSDDIFARTEATVGAFSEKSEGSIADPGSSLPFLPSQIMRATDVRDLAHWPLSYLIDAVEKNDLRAMRALLSSIQADNSSYSKLFAKASGDQSSCGDNGLSWLLGGVNSDGNSALHVASKSLGPTMVLIEYGADANKPNDVGDTPLHLAVRSDCSIVTSYLLQHGACIETRNDAGNTPLMVAVDIGSLNMCQILLQQGADPYARRHFGNDAMMISGDKLWERGDAKDLEVFFFLLEIGLNPNRPDVFGEAPMHGIFIDNSFRGLFLSRRLSIESTPPINWAESASLLNFWDLGDDKFHLLVRVSGKDATQRVLNLHPSKGVSPLCVAASKGRVRIMKQFISVGADIEFEGAHAGTALMMACEHGRFEAIKFLVRSGAKLSYFSETGGFRSAVLAAKNYPNIVLWLLVDRHRDQPKISQSSHGEHGNLSSDRGFWTGPTRVGLPLRGSLARQSSESSLKWLGRLNVIRQHLRGKVVIGADLIFDTEEVQEV